MGHRILKCYYIRKDIKHFKTNVNTHFNVCIAQQQIVSNQLLSGFTLQTVTVTTTNQMGLSAPIDSESCFTSQSDDQNLPFFLVQQETATNKLAAKDICTLCFVSHKLEGELECSVL